MGARKKRFWVLKENFRELLIGALAEAPENQKVTAKKRIDIAPTNLDFALAGTAVTAVVAEKIWKWLSTPKSASQEPILQVADWYDLFDHINTKRPSSEELKSGIPGVHGSEPQEVSELRPPTEGPTSDISTLLQELSGTYEQISIETGKSLGLLVYLRYLGGRTLKTRGQERGNQGQELEWEGHITMNEQIPNLGTGVYHYTGRLDCGTHEIQVRENGKLIHVWGANTSYPGDRPRFALFWKRITGDAQIAEEDETY
jgi:hypothetical protein